MKRISVDLAGRLIDFDPRNPDDTHTRGFGRSQLDGTVAAYNMLVDNQVAYIADEVGMGKTYVALGVMGLLRHFKPDARIVVIAPRENIQLKWIKELRNFVEHNWMVTDGRVKSVQGDPVHEPLPCHSLTSFAQAVALNADRDLFLRMTSFSLALKQPESRKRYRDQLKSIVPWLDARALSTKRRPDDFRDAYGRALNAVLPPIDLLIVDESHNLKHGFGERHVSIRNRILGLALGHESGADDSCPWYGGKVRNLLMLSATPFETDFADLYRQLDVLGKGQATVRTNSGKSMPVRDLVVEPGSPDKVARQKEIAENLIIRRVSWLDVAGDRWTKNMYRREWRGGGYRQHDDPIQISDPEQRLVVGLVQKKVAEVIGSEQFNNSFQIGMLSSFESFLETITRQEDNNDEESARTFDGDQDASSEERRGADSLVLGSLLASHRERFDRPLSHPKLDATSSELASAFQSGEKSLVFVRRVATVGELASKLNRVFDEWVRTRIEEALPDLHGEIDRIFVRYRKDSASLAAQADNRSRPVGSASSSGDPDEGGTDSFFAWFFRGAGPKGLLSGAAFQKNRLAAKSSVYSTLFEDDYVAWILGNPADPLQALTSVLGVSRSELDKELRQAAWSLWRSQQKDRYPRYYVFEAYQAGALDLLAVGTDEVARRARIVRREMWPDLAPRQFTAPPSGFPGPETAIGITSFFTTLPHHPELREKIWPESHDPDFTQRFRQREQRRELISAMLRLGASYVDLYLLAIRRVGSFRLGQRTEDDDSARDLATDLVGLLNDQRGTSGFHAYAELSAAASAFDTLVAVNFPGATSCRLPDLAEIFGRALQHQVPVGAMSGGVNRRLVGQFRMPGFPLVLVTTDVLQEGEDLHTFCRRVVHYGIAWTPSSIEQRTGRIDRIGSLVQREIDGCEQTPDPEHLIQVHYPHLQGTVEVLQVRRVLQRLNRFMRLVHRDTADGAPNESKLDTLREILARNEDIAPLQGPLESAFPILPGWLEGDADPTQLHNFDVDPLIVHLEKLWNRLTGDWLEHVQTTTSPSTRRGRVLVRDGEVIPPTNGVSEDRQQVLELQIRSHPIQDLAILRCRSPIGRLNLSNPDHLDELYELQRELAHARVCAKPHNSGSFYVTIEEAMTFHPDTTQYEEVVLLLKRACGAADEIERRLLAHDADINLDDE